MLNSTFFNLTKDKYEQLSKGEVLKLSPLEPTSQNSRAIICRLRYYSSVRDFLSKLTDKFVWSLISIKPNRIRALIDLYMVCASLFIKELHIDYNDKPILEEGGGAPI